MPETERSGMDAILTSPPDLSGWPSKLDAARLLGIGERTLDRQIARTGAPEIRMRPRNNGRKPEPVCNPEDLERLVAERKRAVPMPRGVRLHGGPGQSGRRRAGDCAGDKRSGPDSGASPRGDRGARAVPDAETGVYLYGPLHGAARAPGATRRGRCHQRQRMEVSAGRARCAGTARIRRCRF